MLLYGALSLGRSVPGRNTFKSQQVARSKMHLCEWIEMTTSLGKLRYLAFVVSKMADFLSSHFKTLILNYD